MTVGTTRFKVNNEDNTLCLSCHATHGPFSAIPKYWIQNPTLYNDSIGTVVNQHTRHNVYDPKNLLNSGGGGRCSNCHMTQTATTAIPYDISTHTWNVIPPVRTLQFVNVTTPTQGMLNTCASSCHRNPPGGSIIPSFGITDASLTNWREATDVALAESLWVYWQAWGWTGVKELPTATLPGSYELSQNFPNPFNPSTRIVVDVPKRERVRLAIYNVIGQEVARLMDGEYGAGKYEVTWNGRNDEGFSAPSGVYFYTLSSEKFSTTKKMLLVK